ncbi:MAG: hypothetical protein BWY47_01052 [Bacteroidetes bacterium ADurb.Bin302]|nr:MAG: hypothetical protein BWY47_01052 [Bacteroidetes bacterium ADurb.Bin302]
MNDKLEQQLMDRFPWFEARNVFTNKKLGFPHPCECDNGWYQLIYNCMEEIEQHYKSCNADISKLRIYQIKEKFASLRIYLGSYLDGIGNIINKYEDLSVKICEICGEPGHICVKGSWFQCLCDKHRDEFGYKDSLDETEI